MQENQQYPMESFSDTRLRIEALVQARNAEHGKTPDQIRAAAEVFYGFLKG